jgi:hypothetical protein
MVGLGTIVSMELPLRLKVRAFVRGSTTSGCSGFATSPIVRWARSMKT